PARWPSGVLCQRRCRFRDRRGCRHAIEVAAMSPIGIDVRSSDNEWRVIMTEIEILTATMAIHALKARYFRTMDSKDWAGLEAVFAPDLVADFRESSGGSDETLLTHGA